MPTQFNVFRKQNHKLTLLSQLIPCKVSVQTVYYHKYFSPTFQSRTSQTRLSSGTNQIRLVHIPSPHKHFLLYQHFHTQSEYPQSQTYHSNSRHYQSVTITAFRIPLDENCALMRYYVSSGNLLTTFWGQLIGPMFKVQYS